MVQGMWDFAKRVTRITWGLFVFSIGATLTIRANIGHAPWNAFGLGVASRTGLSYGDVMALSGLVIIGIDWLLKERIGIGTLLDALLVGKFVDLILSWGVIPEMPSMLGGIPMMLLGQAVGAVGIVLYMRVGMGSGPRDALMVALAKRYPQLPIGLVRGVLEMGVLAIGWALGAKVGVGTVLFVLGASVIMQIVFRLMRFEPKTVQHEDVFQTFQKLATNRPVGTSNR